MLLAVSVPMHYRDGWGSTYTCGLQAQFISINIVLPHKLPTALTINYQLKQAGIRAANFGLREYIFVTCYHKNNWLVL
jgi:hypothetical protein